MSTPVEATGPTNSGFSATAAFFDLDKTLIARSSTLAFGPPLYRHGLLSRGDMMRGAFAQLRYRVSGADHRQMEKLKAHALQACQGWPVDRVTEIVTEHLKDLILPYVYAEALALLSDHRSAGQDVIIVSTSGQEVVAPIGALLGVESVIATPGGESRPRTAPYRCGPRVARALVQWRVRAPAGATPGACGSVRRGATGGIEAT